MKAIVGLGNPGKSYAETRHNYGFMVLDRLAEHAGISFKAGKGDWVYSKLNSETVLIKPISFMNNSGMAVTASCNYFNAEPENMLLVYDDIDLPLGSIRFREKGHSGGHRGVEDVIYQFANHEFPRLKLGIANNGHMRPAEKFVLRRFKPDEKDLVNETINVAVDAINYYLKNGVRETMNTFNKKPIDEKGENG